LKPLAALMFNLALSFCTTTKLKHPVALFLDEFTNFGYVRGLPDKLTIIRHDKIPIVLGVQDYVQLENLYGKEAKKFLSQTAGKIFFKPNDYETAKQISTMLGDVNKNEDKVTSAGQLRDVKEKEPLLSVDDLLNLGTIDENNQEAEAGKPNMIVFLPATRPVQVRSLTWRDYQTETDELLFPLPKRRVLEVDEKLARTRPKVDAATEEISSEELYRDRELRDEEAVDDFVSTDELDSDTKPKTQENESPGADDNEYGYLTW
jgi:type IV secretory pathway TraG/TraD family ATPase VirD4